MFISTVMFKLFLTCSLKATFMTSVSTNTVMRIRQVLRDEHKPQWMTDGILNNFKSSLRHNRLVVQKDFMQSILRKGFCTKDVKALANKIVIDPCKNKESIS